MRKSIKSKLSLGALLAMLIFLVVVFCISIYKDIKAGEIQTLIDEYPVWVVSASGDSTFQTVQIIKCWEVYPNGRRELLGYKVAVDSSGYRIYEEESVWFFKWAIHRASSLKNSLANSPGGEN